MSRTYHNLTAHYNVYFNGKEAYKKGKERVEEQKEDNYTRILPVFASSDPEAASAALGDMDKVIKKASKTIKFHSIKAKPKQKSGRLSKKEQEFYNKKEYNKWVDDSYLLMGKAYYYKREFFSARQNFQYIIREFNEDEVKTEAMIWLARTYQEDGNYKKAKEWFDQVDAQKEIPKDLKGLYHATYSDFYIRQDALEEAIPHLKKAIEFERDKQKRIRYTYIVAQIYKRKEDYRNAANMFKKVYKSSAPYEMEFQAKINMAECYGKRGGSYKSMQKLLTKMLKDDKNIEYQDQIYYALGEIEYKMDHVDKAIEYYRLSSEKSMNNTDQKAISCLKLGRIYYKEQDYKNAAAYMDTCISYLPEEYPNYHDIKSLSKNLSKLVENVTTVELEDSLQQVAQMSEKERNKLIDKIIQDVIEEEKRQQEMERQQQINSMLFDQRRGRNPNVNAPDGGKWYFYNPATLSFGENEFRKKWGKRELEDHWRRKNKASMSIEEQMVADSAASDSTGAKQARITDNKSREFYLQDLPLNDSLMAVSHTRIEDALFKMGKIYNEDFSDYDRSISAFEELNERYPDNDYKLLSFYNLYSLYDEKNVASKTNIYKQKVIENYPESHYAKLLQNPNYISELIAKQEEQENLYEKAYQAYQKYNSPVVRQKLEEFREKYPKSEILPKFEFLNILAQALNVPQKDFKMRLVHFVQEHPQSSLSERARDILEYLGESDVDKLITELEQRPDPSAEDSIQQKSQEEIIAELYKYNETAPHYYVIYADQEQIDTKRLRFEVSNFNIFTFNLRTFKVVNYLLDETHELVIVKPFRNKRQAVNYMKLIYNNQNVFKQFDEEHYTQFVISEPNYETLSDNKDVASYLKFFRMHYTNK